MLLGYAFATGLATSVATKVLKEFEVVEVVEPPKVEEEPPPRRPSWRTRPFVPPPDLPIELPPPPQQTITTQAEVRQTAPIAANVPTAPKVEAPAAPPPPPVARVAAQASGRNAQAISRDDYPPASVRAEETGTVSVKFTIGTDGKIVAGSCTVTKSSGFDRLDKRPAN
ncbi:energy transducer TonB [Hankyongella ginsenosidimutans]|uniref:energy transducer TonB n=1 Tax=Hankyongella ginsenosidimutans TaxID=1763828 RepID=UPI001CA30AAD|nr:energy transducer TonB [Hankyongella ginsenosidimutans]